MEIGAGIEGDTADGRSFHIIPESSTIREEKRKERKEKKKKKGPGTGVCPCKVRQHSASGITPAGRFLVRSKSDQDCFPLGWHYAHFRLEQTYSGGAGGPDFDIPACRLVTECDIWR